MTGPYDDMLNLPHPTSRRHSRMSRSDRAAQFAPFAALSGHGTAIAETASAAYFGFTLFRILFFGVHLWA